MKNVPTGEVMLGGELQDKMDISFVTRALLSMFTKFFMALNPFLHFGFGCVCRWQYCLSRHSSCGVVLLCIPTPYVLCVTSLCVTCELSASCPVSMSLSVFVSLQ